MSESVDNSSPEKNDNEVFLSILKEGFKQKED